LTPSIDHLFGRVFIGFENNGTLIISPVAHRQSLQRMGINTTAAINVGVFTSGQKHFLGVPQRGTAAPIKSRLAALRQNMNQDPICPTPLNFGKDMRAALCLPKQAYTAHLKPQRVAKQTVKLREEKMCQRNL